ncbi:MAG TPA: heparinase II/III family protein, partial [Candidatus Acidoferrales bacterium]|nr:heparinase II/III family protein [Candidatus Acidoferrales bacterium]
LDGRPVIVDPGLPCYADDPAMRNLFRSTRYHNTVEVAGAEQNRFWPALLFRIVDDTRSRAVGWHADESGTSFAGCHAGYLRLPESALVRRELRLAPDDTLAVRDLVELGGPAAVAWYFHCAPEIAVELAGPQTGVAVSVPAGMELQSRWRLGPVLLSVWTGFSPPQLTGGTSMGWIAPRFGQRIAAPILEFRAQLSGRAEVLFVFAPGKSCSAAADGKQA